MERTILSETVLSCKVKPPTQKQFEQAKNQTFYQAPKTRLRWGFKDAFTAILYGIRSETLPRCFDEYLDPVFASEVKLIDDPSFSSAIHFSENGSATSYSVYRRNPNGPREVVQDRVPLPEVHSAAIDGIVEAITDAVSEGVLKRMFADDTRQHLMSLGNAEIGDLPYVLRTGLAAFYGSAPDEGTLINAYGTYTLASFTSDMVAIGYFQIAHVHITNSDFNDAFAQRSSKVKPLHTRTYVRDGQTIANQVFHAPSGLPIRHSDRISVQGPFIPRPADDLPMCW